MIGRKLKSSVKWSYKIVRSIVFSLIVVAFAIFSFLFIALSIPPVQNKVKTTIENELTNFLNSEVSIETLSIRPLNEVMIENAAIKDLNGKQCLSIGKLGAGINIWRLIFQGKIEITYVELLDFDISVYQEQEGEPLNIDFIIKAFTPKEKKEPTPFDLKIRNIVIRDGKLRFDKEWQPKGSEDRFDPNHISIEGLAGDVTLPRVSNHATTIDLRRLSFKEKSGLQLKQLSGIFAINDDGISVSDFNIKLPQTSISTSDFTLPFSLLRREGTNTSNITLHLIDSYVTPSNLSAFYPPLSSIQTSFELGAEISGNHDWLKISDFSLTKENEIDLKLTAEINDLASKESLELNIDKLESAVTKDGLYEFLSIFPHVNGNETVSMLSSAATPVQLSLSGQYKPASCSFMADALLKSPVGELNILGSGLIKDNRVNGDVQLKIANADIASIRPGFAIEGAIEANIMLTGQFDLKKIENSSGRIDTHISELILRDYTVEDINLEAYKEGNDCSWFLNVNDDNVLGDINGLISLNGPLTAWNISARLENFDTIKVLREKGAAGIRVRGNLNVEAIGNNIDNLTGELSLSDFSLTNSADKSLSIHNLIFDVSEGEDGVKTVALNSDLMDIMLEGEFVPSRIPAMVSSTLNEICPVIFRPTTRDGACGYGEFEIKVKDAQPLIDYFDLPVFPLTEMVVTGNFDSADNNISVSTSIPYIQQGAKNLITGTYLDADLSGGNGTVQILAGTVYPTKKGLLKADVEISGGRDVFNIFVEFNRDRNVSFFGDLLLSLNLDRSPLIDKLEINANFSPSVLHLNEAEWKVNESEITYTDGYLNIENFSIRHGDQYVQIGGMNNKEGEGEILVSLADIDMDYVFGTLNINHVSFGGIVSGEVVARDIFSPDPFVETKTLVAKNFSYNNALLGEGDLRAKLNLPQKKIAIGAIITEDGRIVAEADGGVWFGRDSLAFDFKADKVNIGFMQPFMSAFSSDVKGRATGEALLYGTFSDIDMKGTIFADNVEILIDYVNTRYFGSDTVYINPGKILVPDFKIYDKFGNSAVVDGVLTHRYFHEPVFNFKVTEMDHLLVYDTNASMNNLWYGTIFASGNGEIAGRPGLVRIAADVETKKGSDFTFVLSDQQEAVKSHFLTFSDKKKEAEEALKAKEEVPAFLQKFRSHGNKDQDDSSDVFSMDFRVSVTDDIRFNLIMDPIAGDKIVAYGTGAMNLVYSSLTDDLLIYGKYILDKGTYNFSLQDIILKEFTIKPGSSISFTGDPYTGMLNITAAYRVNTNLTELDSSFANDRELNRTSVPVEALLKVTGRLTSPDISFDIDLPTVTQETAQKVRSIISTEDMMNRQVLFLVALNKFYPPEYMSTSFTGGEWASVASSTISSQLQNIIGQITDKFTLAPSIRSDKGDFSDVEVDLALSSQLFNNRLLINGNLGYRDPSNSSTTFVGDFDLEYLLNKKGTWRLKAYNHFNDQNYYLKSALTTQGLGIVWRKEFGLPRKKKAKDEAKEAKKEDE